MFPLQLAMRFRIAIAFDPTDDRTLIVRFHDRFGDSLGNQVGSGNASENIDDDTFDPFFPDEKLERLVGPDIIDRTAQIKEIRRLTSGIVDRIHRRHAQTRAIADAADLAS